MSLFEQINDDDDGVVNQSQISYCVLLSTWPWFYSKNWLWKFTVS